VFILLGVGIVMLTSASSMRDQSSLVRSQSLYMVVGLVAAVVMACTDYRVWGQCIWVLVALGAVGLILCYVPGVGHRIKGASRWIGFGGFTVQPSEFAKIVILLFLGWWYGKNTKQIHTFWIGFLAPGLVVGALLGLILFEKDIGTTLLLAGVTFVVWFVAGVRWHYLAVSGLAAGLLVSVVIMKDPERMRRIEAYVQKKTEQQHAGSPGGGKAAKDKHALGEDYQQQQSLIALGSGGPLGLGLGESRQKMYYVPEAHTDFIFSIIGEELGMRATLMIVLCYVVVAATGGYIAVMAKDATGSLLATGIVTLVSFQAFINIGVVTKLLPNKGLALPFISAGGSNMVACMALVGLLISVAKHSPRSVVSPQNVPFPQGGMA